MLTALSVSRDCLMVDSSDSVVLVHAQELTSGTSDPALGCNEYRNHCVTKKLHIEWLVDEHKPLHDVKVKVQFASSLRLKHEIFLNPNNRTFHIRHQYCTVYNKCSFNNRISSHSEFDWSCCHYKDKFIHGSRFKLIFPIFQ